MPEREYTNADAASIVENEGLGYAVQHYCSAESFADIETRRLWKLAEQACNDLEKHLEDNGGLNR
jgi:hypothetical protein